MCHFILLLLTTYCDSGKYNEVAVRLVHFVSDRMETYHSFLFSPNLFLSSLPRSLLVRPPLSYFLYLPKTPKTIRPYATFKWIKNLPDWFIRSPKLTPESSNREERNIMSPGKIKTSSPVVAQWRFHKLLPVCFSLVLESTRVCMQYKL